MKRILKSLVLCVIVLASLSAGCSTFSTSQPPTPTPSPTASPKNSRLPDTVEANALLIHLVDVEKRAPGIVVGMIAADPQERWVVGYGRLCTTDERVPPGSPRSPGCGWLQKPMR